MRKIILIALSMLILNTFGFSVEKEPEAFQAQYYDNAKLLRVKFVEGEAFVRRSYDDAYEEASINLPIFEKDSIGTTEGRLEVYLGRLNYLRLDFDTEVEFNRVPELRKTSTAIRLSKGGIYLDVENLDFERDVEIQTPDCGIFLLDKGVYRINVNEAGATEVFVYEGMAEVSGKDYSRNVRESQKIVMLDGNVQERPFFFYASDTDGFDKWNQKRGTDVGYARYSTSRYLSSGYEDYEYELSRNGRWVYNTGYREYIWIPYNIGVDWSPYYNGRWVWSPFYGYVWSSYDPWGYFTHHYGRWHWDSFYGWHWYPGYHWSPAWVYWSWNDHYYGWCPLSRWNRPVIVINKHWMRNYDYRHGIPIHSRATVLIKKNQLNASNIRKVALKRSLIKENTIGSRGFAPKIKPSIDKVRVINARGKTVEYKKSGLRIDKKYQAVKSPTGLSETKKEAEYKYSKAKNSSPKNAFKYSKRSETGTSSTTYKNTDKNSDVKYKSSEVKSKYKSSDSSPTIYRTKTSSSKAKYQSRSSSGSSSKSTSKASSKSSGKSSTKSGSSRSSSSGKSTKVKKKDGSPSYSSYPSRSNSYKSDSSSSSYRSSYGSSTKSPVKSNRTTSYYNYSSPSYKSSGSSSPSRSRSYSRPSYKSSSGSSSYSSPRSYSSSRSSRSYSGSSSGSSRSYSRPSSSSRSSSSHSSSSRSSSSRSSSSRSSSVKSSKK